MRDDICTIPISEVFENGDGCPICRMRDMLSDRLCDYILGAAMMEPDVRIETNRLGFCGSHLKKMMGMHKRLPLALTLETHLQEIGNDVFKKGLFGGNAKKSAYKLSRLNESCFVCDKVEWGMSRLVDTLFRTYDTSLEFRELFRKQDFICLPHYRLMIEQAQNHLQKQPLKCFTEDCTALTKSYLDTLYGDVHEFTKMFDYRNSSDENYDCGNAKTSIERAYGFLCADNEEL